MFTILRTPAAKLRLLGVVALIGVMLFTGEAISRILGGSQIVGLTSTTSAGCSCHGTTPNTATTLSVSSATGSFTVEPSSTTAFTVSVSNATQTGAGVGIAVKTSSTGATNAGSLSVASGSGLQVVSNEITHDNRKTMSSGTATFTFSWNAPADHGTYYIQAIGNAVNSNGQNTGDAWNWMSAQAVNVAGVKLTSPNGGATYCSGANLTITWTSTAVTNVKLELSADGGNTWPTTITNSTSAAAGSYTWAIPSNQTVGTNYRIRVSDAATAARLDASDASFSIVAPPAITTQPTSQTVCAGQQITLSVEATGTNLTYQWRKAGSNIAGATSATYTIASATFASAGSYDVVVSNACSTTTSSAVNVAVNQPPAITMQPNPQTICIGQPATFSVTATGAALTYQWRKAGVNIAGATSSSYTIGSVSAGDAANYDVVINGTCSPSKTSNAVALTVQTLPSITAQPTSVTVCAGESATFSVGATGSALTYQWRRNGTAIAGATNATYTIGTTATTAAGTYDVVVGGACTPSVTSSGAALTVNPTPAFSTDPLSQVVCEGSSVTLTSAASGSATTYQWRRNGQDIAGATSASLTIDDFSSADLGGYDVVATLGTCFSVSATAILQLTHPAEITGQPTDKSGVSGSTIELTVTATGDDLAYQWKKNGADVNGGTSATLTLSNVQTSDAGIYTVVVSNACTTITSSEATVTVLEAGAGAVLSLSPSTVDFGPSRVGVTQERVLDGVIRNAGDSVLTITAIAVNGASAAEFGFAQIAMPLTIPPGEARSMTVRFTPSSVGAKTASIAFTSNSKTEASLSLLGQGAIGSLSATTSSIGFGGVAVGSSRDTVIQLCNASGVAVIVESFGLLGIEPFSVIAPAALPVTVAPGSCLEVTVRFSPSTNGEVTDILTVRTDGQPANLTIGLSGTGGVSAVDADESLVASLVAVPSPATDDVAIVVSLERPMPLEVIVVDARGTIVHRFVSDEASRAHRFVWDGSSASGAEVASGAYRIVARAGRSAHSTAVILVR